MKKVKTAISLLLALSILLSCCAAAFAADAGKPAAAKLSAMLEAAMQAEPAAADEAAAPELSENAAAALEAVNTLLADRTNINTATPPTDPDKLAAFNAKLAKYDAAVAAYKALTVEEKNAFPVEEALKFLQAYVAREGYVLKAEHDANLGEGETALNITQAWFDVTKDLDARLGEHPARSQALALAADYLNKPYNDKNARLNGNMKAAAFEEEAARTLLTQYVAAYKAADSLTRQYMDGVTALYTTALQGVYFSAPRIGSKLSDLVKMMGQCGAYEDPFTQEKPPAEGTAPKVADYPLGADDPAYIEALNTWLAKKLATMTWNQSSSNHVNEKHYDAMAELAAAIPEWKQAFDVAAQLRSAFILFDTTGATDAAEAAIAACDAITDETVRAMFDGLSSVTAYYQVYMNAAQNNSLYSNISTGQLYKKCQEAVETMSSVRAFEDYILNINLDTVNNGVVAQAQAEYAKVPATLKGKISKEALERYNAVIALYDPVKPLTPSDDRFEGEIASFNPTTVYATKFPCARTAIEYTIQSTNRLAGSALQMALAYSANGTLNGYQNYTILSNASMSTLLSLYDMIASMELSVSGIDLASILSGYLQPSDLADWLSEEKFAGARAKLLAAAETDDTTAAFASIAFENGDWGFEDGDTQGFAEAVAAMLRPVANILHNGILIVSQIIALPNSYAPNGDYQYGAYEKLIPLLEGLGLKGVISSEEYTARFQAAAQAGGNAQLDALFLPVVSPIVTLADELQQNPLNTLLDLLPRLARVISTNTLNDCVNNFLHSSSLLSGVNLDLSGDAINGMIAGQKLTISLGDNAQLTTTLKAVDWARLAGCGQLVLAESVSASNAYRTFIESDRANAYVVVSQYLIKTVLTTRIEGKTTTVALGV